MSPKLSQFSRETVGEAALALVREKGWDALSARNLAQRLGSSVAPVYGAFPSMEELEAFVLGEILRLIGATIRDIEKDEEIKTFLAMGIGLARFARDEPELFLALLKARKGDALSGYKTQLRSRLDADPSLGWLGAQVLDRVFERLWIFTVGLMVALVYGYDEDSSDEALNELMRSTGGIIIYGEAAGLGDPESPALREAWARLYPKRFPKKATGRKDKS